MRQEFGDRDRRALIEGKRALLAWHGGCEAAVGEIENGRDMFSRKSGIQLRQLINGEPVLEMSNTTETGMRVP